MKCHVCAAVGVLMLAGPALTRWAQDDEVWTVSVAPSEETAENQGVAAVLNRIFRSPVTEATTVATVQDDGELAQELRELAELEREVATRTAEEAERQFEEVLLQLELTEDEHARQQVEAAQRSLSEAERARLLAERFLAEGDLEDALSQLEQAEEARERAVEETTLMDELAELERAETECEALERALRENQRAAAELTFRGSHRQALESLEQALAQREVEFQQRDVRAEYERALGAYKRAESLRATRFIEAQRDRSTALGFARTRLAEAKADPERLTRWTAALERLGRRPEVSRDPANAISAGRSARQDNQAEIVERLKALDRRLAELGAKQEAAEHSDTCNHCDACRALHAERGAHTAPERTRRRTRGRGLLPSEPRAPRPPREPREPRAPRLPHEPRAPQASIYTRLPHAGLPTSAPRPEYSGLVPLPALTPAVPPPTPSTGESGCCCCSTCPRCGASTAPKSDTRPMTGGVSGIYATPRAFAKVPIEFGVFAGPPSVTPPTFPLGAFETPTLPEYSFGTWPTTETADDPCEADDDPDDGDTPGALVFGQLAEAWNGYNLAATAHPLGAAFQGFVLKTCSDGECGEKGCMTCNAGSWPGTQSETKDGTTYWVSGQGSGKSFVYYVGDEDDEEDEGGRFTWDTGSDNWFVTKSPGKGFVYSFGDDDEDEEDDDDDEDEEDGRFDWKTGTGNWFVTKGPGEGFVYSVGEDERFNWKTGTGNWFVHKGPGTDFDFSFDDDDVDELGDHGEVLAEILELMEDMSLHLEELRGDVRGLREEVGAYSKKVERRLPGARER